MPYTLSSLVKVLKEIANLGYDYVIIGDTVVYLELRSKKFSGDLDLFITNTSPFMEEESIRSVAEERKWGFGFTDIGTPRLVINTDEGDIVVEFYENIYDFYIPPEILSEAHKKKIKDIDVKLIHVEDYLLLKARAGAPEDYEKLVDIIGLLDKKGYKINQRILWRHLGFFPQDERNMIITRLKELGLRL